MKKMTFSVAIVCYYATLITYLSSSQAYSGNSKFKIANTEIDTDVYQFVMPENTVKNYRNDINVRAVREFVHEFKEAENVSWQKTLDGGCRAEFKADSIKTAIWFDRRGSWTYIIKKYGEHKMPIEVRTAVKSNFFDHALMEVTEIRLKQDREKIIYTILIKNAYNFKIIKVCNLDLEVMGDYYNP